MPEPTGPTQVVTFYSYKGGVGRTMALVNTAFVLAREGWRVLMVDFDLEAPGMTHFFAQDVRRRPAHVRKDSLDLLLDARRTLAEADLHQEPPSYPSSLAEYVVPLSLPASWQEKAPAGIPYRNGRLDLIPATLEPRRAVEAPEEGPPSDYVQRLADLDLGSLFLPGGPGHRFGDHVRKRFVSARFEAPGDALFTLHDPVIAAYDVVLIDSRTGLNEIAGFSVGTVANALVLCSGLNQQSVEGTRYFMKKTGLFDRKRAKRFLVAVGPVPSHLTPEVEKRLRALRRALHLRQNVETALEDLPDFAEEAEEGSLEIAYDFPELVEIPYHPLAALRETVFVTELPKEPIAQAYVRLTRGIRSRLLAGALVEAAQQLFLYPYPLRNPAPTELEIFCESTAERLHQLRLFRTNVTPIQALLPSVFGVVSLPERRRETQWEDLGHLPVAAAVLSLHSGSAVPFERAWAFSATLREEGHRCFLSRCLIYFQSSTPHPLPEGAQDCLSKTASSLRDDQRLLSDVCALLANKKLVSYRPEKFQMESPIREALEGALSRLYPFPSTIHPVWRWGTREFRPLGMGPKFLQGTEHVASGTLRKAPEAMRFLSGILELPAKPAEILHGKLKFEELGGSTLEMAFDRSDYSNTPVGFWPEPLAATVLAAAEGARAVEAILAWLHLARLHYGCAWRVLVDWRYFDEVKENPDFQDFLRQEDEVIARVETRIECGDFPL